MTLSSITGDNDVARLRVGLVVLMVGVAILLAAVGMGFMRTPAPEADHSPSLTGAARTDLTQGTNSSILAVIPMLAILGGTLVVTLLIAAYALFRLTRNLAVPPTPSPQPKPTANEDVWQMHKLPDDSLDRMNQDQ